MCTINDLCFPKKGKVQKGILTYDGEDFFPVEFLKKENEHTVEDIKSMKKEEKFEGREDHNRSG
jgi:hypothetical protein